MSPDELILIVDTTLVTLAIGWIMLDVLLTVGLLRLAAPKKRTRKKTEGKLLPNKAKKGKK